MHRLKCWHRFGLKGDTNMKNNKNNIDIQITLTPNMNLIVETHFKFKISISIALSVLATLCARIISYLWYW